MASHDIHFNFPCILQITRIVFSFTVKLFFPCYLLCLLNCLQDPQEDQQVADGAFPVER